MAVEIVCGNCGKPFGVQPEWAGLAVQCPFCETAVQVPGEITPTEPQPNLDANETNVESVRINTGAKESADGDRPPALNIDDRRKRRRNRKPPNDSATSSTSRSDRSSSVDAKSKSKSSRDDRWKAPPADKKTPQSRKPAENQRGSVPAKGPVGNPATSRKSNRRAADGDEPAKKAKPSNMPRPTRQTPTRSTNGKTGSPDFKEVETPAVQPPVSGLEETISAPMFFPVETTPPDPTATQPVGAPSTETPPVESASLDKGSAETEHVAAQAEIPTSAPIDSAPAVSDPATPLQPIPPAATEAATEPAPVPGVSYRTHPLRFPPTYQEAQDASQQVDIVVRSGVKQIDYNGEKVIVRDDQSLLNIYQVIGFIFSLIILVLVLIWSAFFR